MSWLDTIDEPSAAELWAIELGCEVLDAELRLVDAESLMASRPCGASVATYLRALLDVVDLHRFTDHDRGGLGVGGSAVAR